MNTPTRTTKKPYNAKESLTDGLAKLLNEHQPLKPVQAADITAIIQQTQKGALDPTSSNRDPHIPEASAHPQHKLHQATHHIGNLAPEILKEPVLLQIVKAKVAALLTPSNQ